MLRVLSSTIRAFERALTRAARALCGVRSRPKEWDELEERCKRAIAESGIDGRTSYFALAIRHPVSIFPFLQDRLGLQPDQVERILRGYVADDRYADYGERRSHGFRSDVQPTNLLLSQGYKRGLAWRGIPVGKTCWDVCIYQQLLQQLKPKTLIEFGTGLGGSTLFYLDHCRIFGLDTKIITLDLNSKDVDKRVLEEKTIEFIAGDVKNVTELLPVNRLRELPHPWLIIEDCHTEIPLIVGHLYPFMNSGDYLVIEDVDVFTPRGLVIREALQGLPTSTLLVDTFYTDMFGRNATCSADAIFKKM